jgi:pimeloyl-[acyl-carrier protein] synthase
VSTPTLVDLFAPEWLADPYPFYRRLREDHPVYHDDVLRSWVVSRHGDIAALSTDDRLTEDRVTAFQARLTPETRELMRPLAGLLTNMMLFATGPRHAALRNMAKAGFSRRVVADLRASIERRVAALCDEVLARGEVDLVGDLSAPLTKAVIAEMLGLPPEHRHLLDEWQSLLHVYFTQSDAESARLRRLREVFDALAARGDPPALLGHMLAAGSPESRDPDVVFANFLLIIDAGQVTTTHQIPNAVRALLADPGQLELLQARPELRSSAAEELLRYDSAVQFTARTAREDIELHGRTIPAGDQVTLLVGSGNRDEEAFADPDRLDVTRDAKAHLSFGHGRHYCLGAALALAETELVLDALLSRTRDLRLTSAELEWHETINFRFLKELPVAFEPR